MTNGPAQPQISSAALEQLIPGPVTPAQLENGFQQFKKAVIYTINAIESLNARLRKIIKIGGHFPNDDAATKLT